MLYHGTNSYKAYKSILKTGLRPGTYLTPFLDAAICYGGKYVFALDLEADYERWEVITPTHISTDKILYAQKFDLDLLYHNKSADLIKRMHRVEKEGHTFCTDCCGHGEYRRYRDCIRYLKNPGGGAWKTRRGKIKMCKTCKGYGYTQ